jgi:hypothetical protein
LKKQVQDARRKRTAVIDGIGYTGFVKGGWGYKRLNKEKSNKRNKGYMVDSEGRSREN